MVDRRVAQPIYFTVIILYTIAVLIVLEAVAYAFCRWVGFPSGVIVDRRMPKISPSLVRKFADHGYDPELGWIRKPNTSKVDVGKLYHIDHRGSRNNPGHEHLPLTISTYGDSYTFCRECEDHETWQWHLADQIKGQVLNFGVGNYGLDQALLRLKREYPKSPTPIVVMGIVPETIARILSVWKHYYEHGNLLAFKPRYILDGDDLQLIPNYIDKQEKYYRIEEFIDKVRKYDYFYETKFKPEAFCFPYLFSCLKHYRKIIVILLKSIRAVTKRWGLWSPHLDEAIVFLSKSSGAAQSAELYQNRDAVALYLSLIDDFVRYSREMGFKPILAILPMRDDLVYMKQRGHYYESFVADTRQRLEVIDLAERMLATPSHDFFFARWHYNSQGNQITAEEIVKALSLKQLS